MEFRETLQSDMDFMAEHSISKGIFNKQPCQLNFIYTLIDKGKILGIGGITLINSTTAWAWVDISEYARGKMKSGYRVIRDWMNNLVEIHGLKRLQVYVRMDFFEGIRMAEHLGFRQESVMEKFIDGEDVYLYVRIME